jgi:hypothetical protein
MNYRSSESNCTECKRPYTRADFDTDAKWHDRKTCGHLMCKESRNRRLNRERRKINLIRSRIGG